MLHMGAQLSFNLKNKYIKIWFNMVESKLDGLDQIPTHILK